MYGEMMDYYGLNKDLNKAGYLETESFKQTLLDVKTAINSGGIIAVTGVVGSGKTVTLRQIQLALKESSKYLLCQSLATDKEKVTLNTLYTALFSDLPTDKGFKIPTQPEKRERILLELIRKVRKPIALFIDEAHNLHSNTLVALKGLIETVECGGGVLSIILLGHPKLSNDLNNPRMEEIGGRAKTFLLEGLGTSKPKYIDWMLEQCSKKDVKPRDIITEEAKSLLVERLITPLQICHYLTSALIKGCEAGCKPIDRDIIDSVLTPDLDSIEPKLARYGYNIAVMCEHLNARRGEVRAYFKGQLAPVKTEEFNKEIHKLGII